MRKVIHTGNSRGFADHGWLRSHHSFSFASYYDPNRINFGLLRVLNDDEVIGGRGFGQHPHDNMEIISIPLNGALEHRDTMGNKTVIKENDVQIMSAGKGIQHAEMNHSSTELANFLQIWIFPKQYNIEPKYDQKTFDPAARHNKLQAIVSPDSEGGVHINQDAWLSRGHFEAQKSFDYPFYKPGNGAYIFIIKGKLDVAGEHLHKRDAIGISDTNSIHFKTIMDSDILIIEVPMEGDQV